MRKIGVLIAGIVLSIVFSACAPATPPRTVSTPNFRLHYTTTTTTPRPLVLVLGATGRSLDEVVRVQNQDTYADQQGYVVAYVAAPPGSGNTWATGPNSSPGNLRDDMPYLLSQLASMRAIVPIDAHRVYIEGWSNGGFYAMRAALQRPDVFAAAGEIEAVLDVPVTTTTPIRAVHVHSTRDTVVPIRGGNSPLLASNLGHPVNLRDSYSEGAALPPGTIWRLVTNSGSGAGYHDYQPSAAATFWTFFRNYRR